MKKHDLKPGDTLYISMQAKWIGNGLSEPEEYRVTHVNTNSIYLENGEDRNVRLNTRTLSGDTSTIRYVAFLDKQEYYDKEREKKERIQLEKLIAHNVSHLPLEHLRNIARDYFHAKGE